MRRLFPIALALFALQATGAAGATHRVHDGRTSDVPSYMAFLSASTENAYWTCGATAISANVVLTAAHCVVDPVTNRYVEAGSLRLVFGQDDPRRALSEETVETNPVIRYIAHPDFGAYSNGVVINDVAVLEIRDPVPGVLALLPPERSDLATPGTDALVMGWGLQDMRDDGSTPTTLLSATMQIRPTGWCSTWLEHFDPSVMLCAGHPDNGAAPCSGDSGGPLLVSDPKTGVPYQVGVVSFGEDCQLKDGISVLSRVGGADLYEFVTKAAAELQDEATPVSASGVSVTAQSSNRVLSYHRARHAAKRYAVDRWHWKVRRVSCARRSADGIVCRVDGSRRGRAFFTRMLVMLDDAGGTTISGAR